MPIKLSRVYLRWFRSFNTLSDSQGDARSWEKLDGKEFRFVSVPIDRSITTVVGANESGKSHLLSAIAKTLSTDQDLLPSDICRHCAFNVLDREAMPQIALEFSSQNDDNTPIGSLFKELGLTTTYLPKKFVCLMEPSAERFAVIYGDNDEELGVVSKATWESALDSSLPSVEFIKPDKRFTSHIHISQLLAAYEDTSCEKFFDTMPLNEVGRTLLTTALPKKPEGNAEFAYPEALMSTLAGLQTQLQRCVLAADTHTSLARDLFKDILGVPPEKLTYLKSLDRNMLGYIELFSSDLSERISQTLDLTNYWTQDEDVRLGVDYKDGFFYFEILDRTGKRFTFEERSSGLQYFLSYYVQSLAILKRNMSRKAGCVVMMDEPDRFLSAIAQRNLLQVFERLTTTSNNSLQVVYTTHSPFSINRNFPSRLRLLRKGDGNEGSQMVTKSATRCYEPVRSALGIDSGDTLFFGAKNVIVEGLSDQKAITIAAQLAAGQSGKPALDLNMLTFLRGNGVGQVSRLIDRAGGKSQSDGAQAPVTVCMLDGDEAGKEKIKEIKDKQLLPGGTYGTYADLSIIIKPEEQSENYGVEVLEDLIPLSLLRAATRRYLGLHETDLKEEDIDKQLVKKSGENLAERLVAAATKLSPALKELSKVQIRSEICDIIFDELLPNDQYKSQREAFVNNFAPVLKSLNRQLLEAEKNHRQRNITKKYRMLIEPFLKVHDKACTRFDISNLLRELSLTVTGTTQEAANSRVHLTTLEGLLNEETIYGSDSVDSELWQRVFSYLAKCPWKEPKEGWRKVANEN